MPAYKPGEIEVPQNLKVQYKSWAVQKVAWLLMLLLIIAAALGYFGQGMVSSKTLTSSTGAITLKYEKFMRFGNHDQLSIKYKAPSHSDTISLQLNNEYMSFVKFESIHPQFIYSKSSNSYTFFYFLKDGASNETDITFHIEPFNTGRLTGVLIINSDTLRFSHFIYP